MSLKAMGCKMKEIGNFKKIKKVFSEKRAKGRLEDFKS